jgi:hypothetical protein
MCYFAGITHFELSFLRGQGPPPDCCARLTLLGTELWPARRRRGRVRLSIRPVFLCPSCDLVLRPVLGLGIVSHPYSTSVRPRRWPRRWPH